LEDFQKSFFKKKLVNLSIIAGLQRASNHHPEDLPGLFHDQEGEHFPVRRLHAVHEKPPENLISESSYVVLFLHQGHNFDFEEAEALKLSE